MLHDDDGDLRISEEASKLGSRPVHPRADLCFHPGSRQADLRCPLGQPCDLTVEITSLVIRRDAGRETYHVPRGSGGSVWLGQDGPLLHSHRRHRKCACMEPVVGGLRVDTLAACPLGEVHGATVSLTHTYLVYDRLMLEQFTTPC